MLRYKVLNETCLFLLHYALLRYQISCVDLCAKALQKGIVALQLSLWIGSVDTQPS